MQSKHALILALFAGATALLIVISGLLSLSLLEVAEPYLDTRGFKQPNQTDRAQKIKSPTFITKLEGTQAQIVELNDDGQVMNLIYVSELNDPVADFTLFAVPQINYSGKIYVQSMQDAKSKMLIVYPLEVATGKIGPATLNTPSNKASLSPNQNRVVVINVMETTNIIAYDITTGYQLGAWTLAADEHLNEQTEQTYTEDGLHWTDNNCLEYSVWNNDDKKNRTVCI